MINLLIADDEPLIQVGIKSMINWKEFDINIVGTAGNGAIAYQMIQEHCPEIVITDIKMPIMGGLELAKKCYEEQHSLPVFIILTSFEEFQFVKEAITYQVVDYLIKLELTPDILKASLKRAINKVIEIQKHTNIPIDVNSDFHLFQEQFYTRLLMNLFESEHQFSSQAANLNLNFNYTAFIASYVEIRSKKLNTMSTNQQINLYTSSLQMARELSVRYLPCHVLSLDTRRFAILFFLDKENAAHYREVIQNTLEQVSTMLFNYYSVITYCSVGLLVTNPMQVASSFQDAKQIFSKLTNKQPILFAADMLEEKPPKNVFNMALFREDIRKAYTEFNEKALYDIFTSIMELFSNQTTYYLQALDAAGNILYLSLSLLQNGEEIVSEIFSDYSNGYRSLYELTSVEQILEWLTQLRDGLCESFSSHNKDYKNHIVVRVKKYINEHIEERLTLNQVAEVFNISPNYLSVLFSKYNDVKFTDYVNQSKIETAKKMMKKGDLKVYEISDILGFESAFYFSRVFKKITGMSPRDYINQNEI
ncbi:MAG: AraC family transcriptional regulator [Lachnospiraceae bacterium]